MNLKNLLAIGLLLFVAASVAAVAINGLRENPQAAEVPADGVIAYYFHGDVRCTKCRNIEAYAREAVQSGFAGQIDDGQITWYAVNYEQSGNERFATDYKLIAPSVVLVERSGGKRTRWKNLDRVWELVEEKRAFIEYIQQEAEDFLKDKEA